MSRNKESKLNFLFIILIFYFIDIPIIQYGNGLNSF